LLKAVGQSRSIEGLNLTLDNAPDEWEKQPQIEDVEDFCWRQVQINAKQHSTLKILNLNIMLNNAVSTVNTIKDCLESVTIVNRLEMNRCGGLAPLTANLFGSITSGIQASQSIFEISLQCCLG
jgi:hypothetical protein